MNRHLLRACISLPFRTFSPHFQKPSPKGGVKYGTNGMNLNERIARVDLKARQLGLKIQHLQERNEKLSGENQELQHQLHHAIQMIADLEEQLEAAQAGLAKKEKTSPEEVRLIRKQIDRSIQDVDDAITFLKDY